jgi:hypothetical protein
MSIQSVVNEGCVDYLCGYIIALCCCSCDTEKQHHKVNIPISVHKPTDVELTIRTARTIPIDLKDEPIPKPIAMTPAVHHSKSPDPVPLLIRAHT